MGKVDYGGPVVCAIGCTDDGSVQFCKDYIARHGYTREQVKIIQRDGLTLVIALKRLW